MFNARKIDAIVFSCYNESKVLIVMKSRRFIPYFNQKVNTFIAGLLAKRCEYEDSFGKIFLLKDGFLSF